jgi:hypothetical protein
MSLQLLAKQMEAKGRGGDSVLVHMTPGEVEGLQKLAESAGGSLSVNPETGLVEANFLKRLLPTLAGIGVGMFAGPMAGAAAGALVGGMTAPKEQRNTGILLGALGGYGGAGIGAGLSKAGAAVAGDVAAAEAAKNVVAEQTTQQAIADQAKQAAVANAGQAEAANLLTTQADEVARQAFLEQQSIAHTDQIVNAQAAAKADFLKQGVADRAGQGIQALADQGGRDAFLGEVGMKTAGMAAAPLMTPGERPPEEAPDDEMYVYDFDYGRTGADRMAGGTSSERTYFNPEFSNRRKVRAADYFSAAEGGEVADAAPVDAGIAGGMSGASKAAYDYLMGNATSSAPQGIAAVQAARPTPVVGADNMYAFDPATGTFLRNPNIPGASTSGSPVGTPFSGSGGSDNVPMSQQTIDFLDRETPPQREARMGEVSNLFSLGPVGAFANAVTGSGLPGRAPDFGTLFGTGDAYKNLGYDYNQAGGYNPSSGQSYAESVGMGGDYGYSGYSSGEDRGEAAGGLITLADGGLMGLAKGGMKSGGFVIPADVVSMVGEGNTDAGYSRIKSMVPGATAIKGKDGGQADTVKTSIEGKQPARVAHGEMYIPPETVKRMGGAKKLYAMMDKVRAQATGSKKQIKPVSLKKALA